MSSLIDKAKEVVKGGMHGHSAACCTVPPVTANNSPPSKGAWTEVDGMKTYVTGQPEAKEAILVIYDIFGFFPQTLQGADILGQKYKVFIPDFFEGKPCDISWYPPDTEEKGKKLGEFFSTTGAPPKSAERVPKVIDLLNQMKENKTIEKWGILGFCWGGKIVALTTQEGTPFKTGVACHPAMVDPSDAAKAAVPLMMLPSGEESKEDVEKWEKEMKQKHKVKWYDDQLHGFMAAR
jgi:dienelactone hydrolase